MDPLQFLVPFDWLDVIGPVLPLAILVLALANVGTRLLAHREHRDQAEDADELDRYAPHTFTTVGLVFLSFLLIFHRPTGGTLLSLVAVTLLVADFFEFEARNVEARNDMVIERPKSAMAASVLVLIYAVYYSLVTLNLTFWQVLF